MKIKDVMFGNYYIIDDYNGAQVRSLDKDQLLLGGTKSTQKLEVKDAIGDIGRRIIGDDNSDYTLAQYFKKMEELQGNFEKAIKGDSKPEEKESPIVKV
jgi:hypothetical protein